MFVINIRYIKPIEEIDHLLQAHRNFLGEQYARGLLVCSGPQTPRTGGIIISCAPDRAAVDAMLQQDPFYTEGAAEYAVTEFTPVKYAEAFAPFVPAIRA